MHRMHTEAYVPLMTHQLPNETLAGLRVTLKYFEETADSYSDSAAVADLKQILKKRIAELEFSSPQTVSGTVAFPMSAQ
jgi:hypothetical protein